jgi:hypothetical protein
MNMQDLLKAVIPILVACIAWLLGQVSSFQERLTKIEGKMPALITNEGVPTDSPNQEKRHLHYGLNYTKRFKTCMYELS